MRSESTRLLQFEIEASESKQRLDRYLAANLEDLSRSAIQKIIVADGVQVNGEVVGPSYNVEAGDRVVIQLPAAKSSELVAEALPLDVLYEDDDVIVINKPSGLVVHPAAGHASGTLVNALLYHFPAIASVGGSDRPGIVHRLDKGTSGVLVAAKTESARLNLVNQFKAREVYKEYWALVHGILSPLSGTFESHLGRHPRQRQKIASVSSGKRALTEYSVENSFGGLFSSVRVILQTGRTHQIRVHLSEAGHPIVGDKTYGGNRDTRKSLPEFVRSALKQLERPALHAALLEFNQPQSGEKMHFEAPLPADLVDLLKLLKSI